MRAPWAGPHSLKAKLFWMIIAVILLPQVALGALALLPLAVSSKGGTAGRLVSEDLPANMHTPQPLPSDTTWPLAQLEDDPNGYVPNDQAYLDYVRNRLPADVYEELRRRMTAFSSGSTSSGGGSVPIRQTGPVQDAGAPWQLPPEALSDLRRQGYAMGTTWIADESVSQRMQEADYVAFRVAGNEAYYAYAFVDQSTALARVTDQWWWPVLVFCVWLAVNAVLAFLAAGLLNSRIARPVARVATASALLAAGGEPARLPVSRKEPAEVGLLATSFNDMAAKLRRSQEAEQSFLLSVSHELKTPLTAIRGYGETLTEGRAKAEEAGPVITREAGRLERLVQDVLDLGRARKSTFAVHRAVVDLGDVAREAGRRYADKAREFGVELRVEASDGAIAEGDADRTLQVVSNLVENALRCTPADGSVTIAAVPGELRVIDTGPGLTEEEQAHAFERFYLYERRGKDRPVGTGLGLAIVRELVDAMGGTVTVTSEPGAGTTFVVTLAAPGEASS